MEASWYIPDLLPTMGASEAMQRIMRHRWISWKSLCDAVKENQSAEQIHDFRVASRRLRQAMACLVFYSSSAAKLKHHNHAIKTLADHAGEVRDSDIMLHKVQILKSKHSKIQSANWDYIENQIETKRLRSLKQFQNTIQKTDLNIDISWVSSESETKNDPIGVTAVDLAVQWIKERSEALWITESDCGDPLSSGTLHAFRIEAKRLRYSLEMWSGILGGNISQTIKILKKLQDYLGLIHDCDTIIKTLRKSAQIYKTENEIHNAMIIKTIHYVVRERISITHRFYSYWNSDVRRVLQKQINHFVME